MPLNASGTISLAGSTAGQSISNEFKSTTTSQTSLSEYYRGGSYVGPHNSSVAASGAISLGSFYSSSKRYAVSINIGSNQTNYNLQTSSVSGYSSGWTDVTLTISQGVVIGGTTSDAALKVTGFASGDTIHISNYGSIQGAGGAGNGGTGGIGIDLRPASYSNVRITNQNFGVIGGGGGGGGAGQAVVSQDLNTYFQPLNTIYQRGGGGGGGAGQPGGGGGAVNGTGSGPNYSYLGSAQSGATGGTTSASTFNGGAGGNSDDGYANSISAYYRVYAGSGGIGGNRGASGGTGNAGGSTAPGYNTYTQSTSTSYSTAAYPYVRMAQQSGYGAGSGGAAGYAIIGTNKYSQPISNSGSVIGPTGAS